MKNSDGLSDTTPSGTKSPAKCAKCGATLQLHTGVCVSCLLGEGLEAGDEVSRAVFESVIAEVDVPDKQWRLGDYEILDEIGRGGMGVIYLARQRHPHRMVAVKRVLDYHADSRETLKRFRREADAAASLDHPNILPIYEVSESEDGLPFFSMKFATGGSLQKVGPTLCAEPRRCVQLMAKVAHGVEYAHGHGILHRDLKPGNILLDGRGEPLVSDFGLAKWRDATKDLTKSLTTFGTPGYTAPEQAEGKAAELTPAADVYSLGAVLFNVLAGRPPFLGSNPVSVIRQASETQAPKLRSLAPSLDRDLETICARCLERDPRARYQSAGDLAADLERWLAGCPIVARPVSPPARIWRWSQRNPKLVGAATVGLLLGAAVVWSFRGELFRASQFNPPDRSIAVLPFTDSSETKDQEYLCDGISEEILRSLTKVDGLRVAGRTSSFSLKGRTTKEVGEKLNVGNVLEGSLQRQGNRVRVTAELVDAQSGFRVWTETYERELDSAFELQDEIARSIADALKIKFAVRLSAHEQPGNGVHDLYLQRLFTDVTPTGMSSVGISVPVQNPSDPFTVPNYTSSGDFDPHRPDTRVTAAPPETAFNTNVRDRALEAGLRTNKITADGPASLQGFVKDAKGDPIKGADVRVESRDGKQVFTTVKTDPKGRYISQGLQPGVYRVTLLVSGVVKASIMNTQTKANQPTQLNFDLKTTSQAGNIPKGGKRMVWMPGRTGTHLGGNWVEVDDKGNEHSDSNIRTYSVRRQ